MDPSDDDILDRKVTPIMILWFPPPTRIDQPTSKVSFTSERRKFSGDRSKKCILPGAICKLIKGTFSKKRYMEFVGIWVSMILV